MSREPEPLMLSQVVHRAVEVCELTAPDEALHELLERFEDADEPIAAVADIEERMAEVAGALDPDGDDPALTMAAAVSVYLAYRRDELREDPAVLLRLAARAEFDGDPPPAVSAWLADAGVEV